MIKLIELFGGIGTQAMAMRALKKNFSSIGYVEWNEESVACYKALAKKSIENGTEAALEMMLDDPTGLDVEDEYDRSIKARSITDVTAANFPILHNGKDIFIMFSSFPCQSLSKESKKGREGGGIDPTRRETEPTAEELKSALVWDTIRIFKELHDADPDSKCCLPHYIFMENVIGMIDVDNRAATLQILRTLNDIGYDTELMVIDGNKIGEPQMRKRVFVVSKLRGVGLPDYQIPDVAMSVTDYNKALGDIMRAPQVTDEEAESLKKTLLAYLDTNPETIVPDTIYAAFDPNNFVESIRKTLETGDKEVLKDYRKGLDTEDNLVWNNTKYGIGINNNLTSVRNVKMTPEKRSLLKTTLNSIVAMKMYTPDFAVFNPDFAKHHAKTTFNKFKKDLLDSSENAFEEFKYTDDSIIDAWKASHPEDPDIDGVARSYTNGRMPTTLTKSKLLMIDTVNNVIREPSAKEYGRLQGFTDEDIDEMMITLSNFFLNTSVDVNVRDNRVSRAMNFKTGDSILVPALKVLFDQLPEHCNPSDDVNIYGDDYITDIAKRMDSYKNNLDDRRNSAYKSAAEGVKAINDEYGDYEIPVQELHSGYLNDREHAPVPERVLKKVKAEKGKPSPERVRTKKRQETPIKPGEQLLDWSQEDIDKFIDIDRKATEAREADGK